MADPVPIDPEEAAHSYLASQLGARAPHRIAFAATFNERPLMGEGPTTLFRFDLPSNLPAHDAGHYVAVGETLPNYFPTYALGPDEAYSFHLGTRFMLEMGMTIADAASEPDGARESMRTFVAACNGDTPIEREELAALFRCGAQFYAVYRLTLRGQETYCFGADCPPGFSQLTGQPAQVALRLHLGQLIRAEARHACEHAAGYDRPEPHCT